MFRLVLPALLGLTLMACGAEPAELPPHTVNVRDADGPGPAYATIVTETADPVALRALFDALWSQSAELDGVFVEINCKWGGSESSDNRLANGKFAITQLGVAQTGVASMSQVEFSIVEGAECHSDLVSSSDPKPATDAVIAAFQEAGLPLPELRDTSPQCAESLPGCVERITTENISVLAFDNEADAIAYAEGFGTDAFRRGLVVLSYAAAGTSEEDRAAYEQVFEGLTSSDE